MLAIRMQRTGRKGYAQFRVIVQDSHRSPSTGKIIEYLGSYDPHTKEAKLDKEAIEKYLSNGAQPSNRVAILLKKEGVKLPKWVVIDTSPKKKLKNPEKLRKNQTKEQKEEIKEEAVEATEEAEVAAVEEEVAEKVAEVEEVVEVAEELKAAEEETVEEEAKEAREEKSEKKREEK